MTLECQLEQSLERPVPHPAAVRGEDGRATRLYGVCMDLGYRERTRA